jgi:hypothetical protein
MANITVRVVFPGRSVSLSVSSSLSCCEFTALLLAHEAAAGLKDIVLLTGFPPKPLPFDDSPISNCISANEVVRVGGQPVNESRNSPWDNVPRSGKKNRKRDAVDKSVARAVKTMGKSEAAAATTRTLSVSAPHAVARSVKRALKASQGGQNIPPAGVAHVASLFDKPLGKKRIKLGGADLPEALASAAMGGSGGGSGANKFLRATYRSAVTCRH